MSEGAESSELAASERSTASTMPEAEAREGYKWVQLGPTSIEIPEEWGHVYFDDAITLNPPCELPDNNPVDFLPMDAVNENNRSIDYWTQREPEDCTTTKFENDDTVYGKITPCAENGKIAQIEGLSTDVGSGSTEFLVFRGKENRASPDFVFYLVNFPAFRDVTISLMEGSTGRQRIPTDIFKGNLEIPIPSLPEQRHIAEVLSTVDEQIQLIDHIIENVENCRNGVLYDILRSGFHDHDTSLVQLGPRNVEIPKSWDIRPISDIVLEGKEGLRGGPPGGKIKKDNRVSEGYKVYLQENVIKNDFCTGNEYITEENFQRVRGTELESEDVLITLRGSIGETAVFPSSAEEGILCNSLARLRVNQKLCLPNYVSYIIGQSDIVEAQIKSLSTDSGRKGLHNKIVAELKIPLPKIEEQRDIVELMSEFRQKISREAVRKEKLQKLKRGLMQDLLTGAVRVPESIEAED